MADEEMHSLYKHSKISFVQVSTGVAVYYRNLFLKKLTGESSAELNYAVLIDGKIFAVCGFMVGSALKDNCGYVFENYGISLKSRRFPKLNKLLMRLMLTNDFKKVILKSFNFGISEDIKGIKTTCLSRLPEVRLNSGLLKLVSREKNKKTGIYKLQYYSDFYDKTYKQMIIEHLDEEKRYKDLLEARKDGKDNRTKD